MPYDGEMPTSPGSMSNNTMNMKDNMVMHMSLFWGKNVIILFQGWPNNNLGMYILSLAFVFLLSVAVDALSVPPAVKPGSNPLVGGLTQATVYSLHMALAYLVMLSVMSFNIGIFMAAVAGHTLGFFLIKYRAIALAARAPTTANTTTKDEYHTSI